jgi:F0F1-type ATP synthase membrane subunit b/b'
MASYSSRADYRQTVAEARRRRDELVAAAQAEAREVLIFSYPIPV